MATTSEALNLLKKGKVTKETKASSNALQKENIEVERKLNALKEKMRKEKEERERMGGPRWKSSSQKVNSTSEKKVTKKTIKVLTDQPLEHYKQERKPPPPNPTAKRCGQCDERKAKVECNECAECYCADCYKHFHSRGALRKHTWKSLEQEKLNAKYKQQLENITSKSAPVKRDTVSSVKLENTPTSTDYTRTKEMFTVSGLSVASVSPRPPQQQHQQQQQQTSATNTSTTRYNNTNASPTKQPDSHNVPTASLLHGEYNEEESASSFAEALNEWRRAGTTSSVQTTAKLPQRSSSATATQARTPSRNSKDDVKNLFSQSSSSLSYLDRIIVKKYKKNQQELISAKLPSPTQDRQTTAIIRSSKSVSPVQSVSNANSPPSPCLLSIHATTTSSSVKGEKSSKVSSTVVDIQPCDEYDKHLPAAAVVSPIISYDGSDNETMPTTATTKLRSSPTQRRSSPTQRRSSPTQRRSSPTQRRSSPTQRKSSPTPPTQQRSTPTHQKSNYRYEDFHRNVSSKTALPCIVTQQGKTIDVNRTLMGNSGSRGGGLNTHKDPLAFTVASQNSTILDNLKDQNDDSSTKWKVQPTHTNMEQFFLIGGEERDVNAKDSGVDVTAPASVNTCENIVSTVQYSGGGVWQPDLSLITQKTDQLVVQVADTGTEMNSPHIHISSPQASKTSSLPDYQFADSLDADAHPDDDAGVSYLKTGDVSIDDCLNLYSDDDELYLAADRLMAASPKPKAIYDFIEAMPPLCKGDNHDKLHRSSTSLSISAFPVDIWADSDASLPVSRRSSNLCNSVTNSSRKTSSNYESLSGHSNNNNNAESSTILNFNKLNLLAEEVIARRSEESCGANSGDDNTDASDNPNLSYVVRTASANGYGGRDDGEEDIEDNDAGSGLTTSEESDG